MSNGSMSNMNDLVQATLARHKIKSIDRMSDDPSDYSLYNEYEITCTCNATCVPDEVEDAGDLQRFSSHQAAEVTKIIDKELFATVNKAAMSIARVALREHSGPPDQKLEAGVKGYLYALRNREPRAEFGDGYFCYPSVNDLRNHMRAR